MAFTEAVLTTSYALITSEPSFTAQNITTGVVELIFATSTPAVGDKGFRIQTYSAVDSDMGTGSLYGRAINGASSATIIVSY